MSIPALAVLVATLALAASLTALPATAAAAPQGLIREIPVHANIVDVARGPDGNLWFSENLRHRAIGRVTAAGKVTTFRLPPRVDPGYMVGGPGGLWFTYERPGRGYPEGGVARITRRGTVRLFPLPGVGPEEIVLGRDGNIWVDDVIALDASGKEALGFARITPAGKVSVFSAGLRPSADVQDFTAGPGGVWFADESDRPAIGRVTPRGRIVEYPGISPGDTLFAGPTPGPGGVFFSINRGGRGHIAVERIGVDGAIERYRRGLSPHAWFTGPFIAGPGGNVWFRVERKVDPKDPSWPNGRAAIGRLGRDGETSEFSHCLRPLPGFAGPQDFAWGPEDNLWFVTRESGVPGHSHRASTPAVGRITPAGQITEFRYGLTLESEPEELTFAAGRLWFLDRRTEAIGEIRPPRRPANTFLVSFPDTDAGVNVRVTAPGPGTVRVVETGVLTHGRRERVPGLGSMTLRAGDCGPVGGTLPFTRSLSRRLERRGEFRLALRVTFTPRGGTPFSERTNVGLVPG